MASVRRLPSGRWQAQYRAVPNGKRFTRTCDLKRDAERWLSRELAKVERGDWTDPATARTTVGEWCDTWLQGYGTRRESTVKTARAHLELIREAFGDLRLSSLRPSHVRAWTAKLSDEGREPSYVYALHSRLAQIMTDAVHDGVLAKSPCSRRTSPPAPVQRPYVATTEQVWALYEAMPEHLRVAVLLGAFAGLRSGEACGLRVADVDFMRKVITPTVQHPAEPLKTAYSRWPIPIPESLALELSAHVWKFPHVTLLTDEWGRQLAPWTLRAAIHTARDKVEDLPDGFRYHDLRHFYASLLIGHGADVKVVQTRLRHGSPTTTLRTYTHLWPDSDETTRTTVDRVISARIASTGEQLANREVVD